MAYNVAIGDGWRSAGRSDAAPDVEIVEGADAIVRAAAAWDAIARQGGVATPFQSFEMASACAAAHGRHGDRPRIVIVSRAGRPTLLFPTVVTARGGMRIVRFLGDPLIQYGDVLATPQAGAADFAAAWSAAADPNVACLALFRRVRDDARAAPHIAQAASTTLIQESPLVDLRRAMPLHARDARELRRLQRRLAERGPCEIKITSGPAARPLLDVALALKRDWLATHGFTSSVIGDTHWESAVGDLCVAGSGLAVAALMVAGRIAAVEVALVNATCWYGFLGAFAPEFARMGAGRILTDDCLARARELGLVCYDQLPPSQPYKRRHATGAIAVRDYALALSPLGRLALIGARMLPEIKSLLGALPSDLRRLLGHLGAWR